MYPKNHYLKDGFIPPSTVTSINADVSGFIVDEKGIEHPVEIIDYKLSLEKGKLIKEEVKVVPVIYTGNGFLSIDETTKEDIMKELLKIEGIEPSDVNISELQISLNILKQRIINQKNWKTPKPIVD